MGMLERTALMNMTFPATFNQEEAQALILNFNLLIIEIQLEDFGVSLKIGTHKYLKASH